MIQNLYLKPLFYVLIIHSIVTADDPLGYTNDNWKGSWFPYSPGTTEDANPVLEIRPHLYDPNHGVVMGVRDPECDDAQRKLDVDWDFNPVNYTCFTFDRRLVYKPRGDLQTIYSRDYIPKGYSAAHKCMSQPIYYSDQIPTYGTHRPLWAKYGEYTFLPKQRWVHNLEHGAVVMLYHPCADKNEVNMLRILVKKCLYRHVITPIDSLSPERPLALVTWGHKLEMSKVAPELVIDFIKRHALQGPEQTARDGQYSVLLERHADIISDIYDSDLCKLYDFIQ